MKRVAEMSFTWFILIVFLFLFVATWHYAPVTRLVPLVFLTIGLVLVGLQLWVRYRKPQAVAEEKEEQIDSEIEAPFLDEMKVLGWYLFLLAFVWAFGFLIATPVFLITFLRRWAKEGWLRTVGIAGFFTFLMYLVVELGFRIILYRGWIFSG